jgi:hypothetical protein
MGLQHQGAREGRDSPVDSRVGCRAAWLHSLVGLFLLGDFAILDQISSYLKTLEERPEFSSMSLPDTAVAAWTGSPQSFLDDTSVRRYQDPESPMSRSDVLRHRHNFTLQTTPAESYRGALLGMWPGNSSSQISGHGWNVGTGIHSRVW